jgi:hypothetical protein
MRTSDLLDAVRIESAATRRRLVVDLSQIATSGAFE